MEGSNSFRAFKKLFKFRKKQQTNPPGRPLIWKRDLYLDPDLKDAALIRRRIDRCERVPGVFLVTLSHIPGNMLEIVAADMLRQNRLRVSCPAVVGLAGSKAGAVRLVQTILEDTCAQTGGWRADLWLREGFL